MKQWMFIAFAVIAFTQQPSKAPESKRSAEGKSAQVANQAHAGENKNQPAKPTPSPLSDNQHPPCELNATTSQTDNGADVQGQIKTFTGLLVVVGILQFGALIGQVVIYCRQAKIMARQAHEMTRQRGYMRLQWKAMGAQAELAERSAVFAQMAVKTSERADILLDGASIKLPFSRVFDGNARLVLIFKNFGRTRGTTTSSGVSLIIPNLPIKTPVFELPSTVVGSGKEMIVSFDAFRIFLDKPTFIGIRQGTIPLRFESWLVYRDVFGGSYTTRNVGIFDPRTFAFRLEEEIAG
jgi:hypothetical protein